MLKLIQGDCLQEMKNIPDSSVDLILCDLPYGTTKCKWDVVIPFGPLWEQYTRVIQPKGTVALFGSEPFSSAIRVSNLNMFKYDWVWEKSRFANQMLAKKQPLKIHENISVFGNGNSEYFPVGLVKCDKITKQGSRITDNLGGGSRGTEYQQEFTNYPRSVIPFASAGKTVHPTQKPVPLLEYLIQTYTLTWGVVMDNCMGSGSTGVAAMNINRRFIGIEQDAKYFAIAEARIINAYAGDLC